MGIYEKAERIGEKLTKKSMSSLGALTFGALTGLGATVVAHWACSPKAVYEQKADLNGDGVQDLVLETKNGRKFALYGVKEGDKIIYVPASEMEEKNPDSKADYTSIEKSLNKGR